jgi:hypothetical protein
MLSRFARGLGGVAALVLLAPALRISCLNNKEPGKIAGLLD